MIELLSDYLSTSKARRALVRLRADEGASLLEYAIVCILSLVMMFGIMDFGRALYTYHFVSHAAREATRWAAVNGSTCNADAGGTNPGSCTAPVTCSGGTCTACTSGCAPASLADIQNYVQMITPAGIDPNQVTTTPTSVIGTKCTSDAKPSGCTPAICTNTWNAPGCTVQVQVSYNFGFLVPLVHNGSITLSSTSQMVIAH